MLFYDFITAENSEIPSRYIKLIMQCFIKYPDKRSGNDNCFCTVFHQKIQAVCKDIRSAVTGKYPFRFNLQSVFCHDPVVFQKSCLLNDTFFGRFIDIVDIKE